MAPEQVVIVAGCQQGLNLAAHMFVTGNTPVVVEAPCYRGAALLFESYGGKILPASVDKHGIDVDKLPREGAKLVYVTPSHQFPTGVTLSLDRRIVLLEWSAPTFLKSITTPTSVTKTRRCPRYKRWTRTAALSTLTRFRIRSDPD